MSPPELPEVLPLLLDGDRRISDSERPFVMKPFFDVGVFALSLRYKSSRLRFMMETLLLNVELELETGSSKAPKARVGDMPPVLTPGTVRGRFEKLGSGLLNISLSAFVSFMYCEVTDVPPFGNLSLNLTTGVLGADFELEEFIMALTRLVELGIEVLWTGTLREEGETDLWVFTFKPTGDFLSIGRRVPFVVDAAVFVVVDDTGIMPEAAFDPVISVLRMDVIPVDF